MEQRRAGRRRRVRQAVHRELGLGPGLPRAGLLHGRALLDQRNPRFRQSHRHLRLGGHGRRRRFRGHLVALRRVRGHELGRLRRAVQRHRRGPKHERKRRAQNRRGDGEHLDRRHPTLLRRGDGRGRRLRHYLAKHEPGRQRLRRLSATLQPRRQPAGRHERSAGHRFRRQSDGHLPIGPRSQRRRPHRDRRENDRPFVSGRYGGVRGPGRGGPQRLERGRGHRRHR